MNNLTCASLVVRIQIPTMKKAPENVSFFFIHFCVCLFVCLLIDCFIVTILLLVLGVFFCFLVCHKYITKHTCFFSKKKRKKKNAKKNQWNQAKHTHAYTHTHTHTHTHNKPESILKTPEINVHQPGAPLLSSNLTSLYTRAVTSITNIVPNLKQLFYFSFILFYFILIFFFFFSFCLCPPSCLPSHTATHVWKTTHIQKKDWQNKNTTIHMYQHGNRKKIKKNQKKGVAFATPFFFFWKLKNTKKKHLTTINWAYRGKSSMVNNKATLHDLVIISHIINNVYINDAFQLITSIIYIMLHT